MTTRTVGGGAVTLRSTSFEKFAGVCAILAGATGFLYAVAFVVLQNVLLSGLFLMLGGLLSTACVRNYLRATAREVVGGTPGTPWLKGAFKAPC